MLIKWQESCQPIHFVLKAIGGVFVCHGIRAVTKQRESSTLKWAPYIGTARETMKRGTHATRFACVCREKDSIELGSTLTWMKLQPGCSCDQRSASRSVSLVSARRYGTS